jgi:hypothetical protein
MSRKMYPAMRMASRCPVRLKNRHAVTTTETCSDANPAMP